MTGVQTCALPIYEAWCRGRGIPVLRREVGGGAVLIDRDQLYFHFILPRGLARERADGRVVVAGADKMSSIVDYSDRNTCVLFGDAAGAVLLEPNTEGYGVLDSILRTDGSGAAFLNMKAGGSLRPASIETVTKKEHFAYQEGQSVFKFAVKGMADVSAELLERNHLTGADIAWLVPHQANKRIIDATANRMGLSPEKVMLKIGRAHV